MSESMIQTNKYSRILGVDYGDVRTGLAVSDLGRTLASGIGYVSPGGMRGTAEAVAAEAVKQNAAVIVVGLPKNMDGSEGWRAETVRAFVEILKTMTPAEIVLLDERLSTAEAHKILNFTSTGGKKRKKVIDTLSAQLILQDYLDRNR